MMGILALCACALLCVCALLYAHALPGAHGLLLCAAGDGARGADDADMKIAGREKGEPKGGEEALRAARELEEQRRSGNVEKARALGEKLAESLLDGEPRFGLDQAEDDATRTQRRLLLAYAIHGTLVREIQNDVLQGVALGAFHDALGRKMPDYYKDADESGSFSFYTLCGRRGGDVGRAIGETFAKLAGHEGDEVLQNLGESLYLRFEDVTKEEIRLCRFQ